MLAISIGNAADHTSLGSGIRQTVVHHTALNLLQKERIAGTNLTLSGMVNENRMRLFLVEAKRKEYDDELENFIPQVIAESLAA